MNEPLTANTPLDILHTPSEAPPPKAERESPRLSPPLLEIFGNCLVDIITSLTSLRMILIIIILVSARSGNFRTVETVGAGLVGTFVPVAEPPARGKARRSTHSNN